MIDAEFAGKTALITGGSRGIGRAISIELERHGADIAMNYMSRDRDAAEAREKVEREGVRCTLVKGDVSDPDEMSGVAARARGKAAPIRDCRAASEGGRMVWRAWHDRRAARRAGGPKSS